MYIMTNKFNYHDMLVKQHSPSLSSSLSIRFRQLFESSRDGRVLPCRWEKHKREKKRIQNKERARGRKHPLFLP